ncbi:MAG: glycosyltransferase family 2 protein [Acidobacteria bacterium]|nr:MAG: glycosyltransferase family 2 protein [Acidobacteriota bacterium]
MREIQIVGLIISVLLFLFGLWRYKSGRFSKPSFLILLGLASGLLLLALYPAAGDLVATPLHMERWNAVLFVSILLAFTLILISLNVGFKNSKAISQLVERLAKARFREEHGAHHRAAEIAVLIPAYNEEDNIAGVLERIPKEILGRKVQTFVVVDGGTDGTEEIVRRMAVPVVVQPINRGGGAALRVGYQVALDSGADVVVTLDADGQHLPEEIPALVEPIVNGEADFVNGSRVLGSFEIESKTRAVGVVLFNWLISLLMAKRITDCSNAFRAIRADYLRRFTLNQDQFHTSEVLIEAIKKGARVKEVPITIRRRQSGTTKKPPSLRYGWGFAKAIVSTWLR